ncbi:hypothetical protein [Streptomyces virginiae]|uniref:hypothetical protein n=1 Tax=Streptomyces virginiae TaxID=1961 RepID=UPI00332F4E5E
MSVSVRRTRPAVGLLTATSTLAAALAIVASTPLSAAALPSQTLLYSVDGGVSWASDVNAAPGSQVIVRAWYNNDSSNALPNSPITPSNPGASITTTMPAGFTLFPGSTISCLSPATVNLATPGAEQKCSTDAGQGGPASDGSVWSGSDLTISPINGLFGEPTSATSGYLAMGKTRYVNLHQCVYNNGADNFTSLVNVPDNRFDASTNASNIANVSQGCGPGTNPGYPHVPQYNTSGVSSLDLLGNRYVNLHQCVYNNGADNFTSLVNVPDNRFDASTNASNIANVSQGCGPGTNPGYPHVPQYNTSGVSSLDLLGNRYVNLHQCVYNGGADNFTSLVNVPDNRFDAGTNASNSPNAIQVCGAGASGYPYAPQYNTSGITILDTLDATRGKGFVQFVMIAPSPDKTTKYPQSSKLTGGGTGDPESTGSVTVVAEPQPSSGDWGFPLDTATRLPAGHKVAYTVKWTCGPVPSVLPAPDTSSCTYSSGMRLKIHALNGSTFLHNSVTGTGAGAGTGIGSAIQNAQWDLNKESDGSRVGTCYAASSTEVRCYPTTLITGTITAGDSLITSIPVNMLATENSRTPAFQATWFNSYGEPQRGLDGDNDAFGRNDFYTFVTLSPKV